MVMSDEPILHLVSPRPVSWDTIFRPIAERLGLQLVEYAEWLGLVEASAAEESAVARPGVVEHDSAHNLLAFFRDEGMKFALDTEKAVGASSALACVKPLSGEDAERYVGYWAKVGHIEVTESAR